MNVEKLCPACGSDNLKFLYKTSDRMFDIPGEFTILRCNFCGLVLLHPQPNNMILQSHYPSSHYYAYSYSKGGILKRIRNYLILHYYQPNSISKFISFFIHNVPAIPAKVPGGKILDLGCGTGDTLIMLKKIGWKVYGMDIDIKAVSVARKRGLTNIKLGRYENLNQYKNGYFDVIRLYHVIEHLNNPELCLRLIRKKLKKGGELIIGTPNIASVVAMAFRTHWYNLDSPRHLFLFSPKTLQLMTMRAGFKVKNIEYCSAGGLAGSLQYWLNDKFNLKIDLINQLWIILLFYPIEWLFDKMKAGDIFVMKLS